MAKYFPMRSYDVYENKEFILVFRRYVFTDWVNNIKGFNKDNYEWEEDKIGNMNIIREKPNGKRKK